MTTPRFLLGAASSGSGKTMITCGILQALKNRNLKVASFKCGPDYIDPMFHSRVIETKSRNLDTFFTGEKVTCHLLRENARGMDISVIEGVMGYYDGVAGTTTKASAYDLARVTDTPAVLIINCKGMSVSMAALVKGFLKYREDSRIKGVILNQLSPMMYERAKTLIEQECHIRVYGYVPKVEDCVIESRHLGLVLPHEIPKLKEKLNRLAGILEETLDIDGLLELAGQAGELKETDLADINGAFTYHTRQTMNIAVANDEAFCFFYQDNFTLLEKMGARLIPFSPIRDSEIPKEADGVLFYGGYPELYAEDLSDNMSMRNSVRQRLEEGMPCMAECGGFMYLHEEMEDMEKKVHTMAGVIRGKAYRTPKLSRFGYINLKAKEDVIFGQYAGEIPAHEFHYFDSTNCGADLMAQKPSSKRSWECMHSHERMLAGFPHLHYYGNPKVAELFLKQCENYREEKRGRQV